MTEALECEQICLNFIRFPSNTTPPPRRGASRPLADHRATGDVPALGAVCRSYTHSTELKLCYLSHQAPRAMGRSVLDSMGRDLSSGELDNCQQCEWEYGEGFLKMSFEILKTFETPLTTPFQSPSTAAPTP